MGETREALLYNKPITGLPKLTRVLQDDGARTPRDRRCYVDGKNSGLGTLV